MNHARVTASGEKQGETAVETFTTTFCVGDLISNKSSSFFAVVTSLDKFGIVDIVAIKFSPHAATIVTRGHQMWGDRVVAR